MKQVSIPSERESALQALTVGTVTVNASHEFRFPPNGKVLCKLWAVAEYMHEKKFRFPPNGKVLCKPSPILLEEKLKVSIPSERESALQARQDHGRGRKGPVSIPSERESALQVVSVVSSTAT